RRISTTRSFPYTTLFRSLAAIQIDQGVITVATKRGLRPTAMADITSRARTVFRLVNGVPTAFDSDGKSVRYGRDGLTPMSIEERSEEHTSELQSRENLVC